MSDIARYYDADKNPDEAALPGVPLRDITDDEWNSLPAWLQQSIDLLPFYRKSKPRAPAAPSEASAE